MNNVRVYDLETKIITEIPADELASGMVRARVEGIVGEVWIDAEQVRSNQPKHEFDDEFMDLFREIKAGLDEVYPLSIEEWADGFSRDSNPEQEIAVWLTIAQLYREFVTPRSLSLSGKKDVFGILLSVVNNGHENALQCVPLKTLTKAEAQEVLNSFPRPKA